MKSITIVLSALVVAGLVLVSGCEKKNEGAKKDTKAAAPAAKKDDKAAAKDAKAAPAKKDEKAK